ncbi:MAG: class I SAM-dependent methyltransferase [Elusimicrobiota bacterium]
MLKNECPLCKSNNCAQVHNINNKEYFKCPVCDIYFVKPEYCLTGIEEVTRYLKHDNSPDDSGYKNFLNRIIIPMEKYIEPGMTGLDYGCGRIPVLSMMLREKGYNMELYDKFFHTDKNIFEKRYDFIICSETAEHFHHPLEEFISINKILKPNGYLGIMTQMLDEREKFSDWYYHKDPTHVVFYSKKSMEWLAIEFKLKIIQSKNNVVIFKR